jgi:serine protease Do
MAAHSMVRTKVRIPPVMIVALALAAGATPLPAQRQESTARRPADRTTSIDSGGAQLRRFQRVVDSLTRVYQDEELSWADRRRAGEELDRRMEQFEVQMRMAEQGARLGAPGPDAIRMHFEAPARARTPMGDVLMHAQMAQAAAPRGWIGIVVTGAVTEEKLERGELSLRYWSYPQIASVDPSSPALRAGVLPNDTLIAYNGRDVREAEISLTRLLRPGARVAIRVRRDGRLRDLPVVVDTVPTRIRLRRDNQVRDVQVPRTLAVSPDGPPFPRPPAPLQPPRSVSIAGARSPVAVRSPTMPFFTFTTNGIAGAQMVTISEGLGRTLGTKSGVLVTSVASGVPAHESGLRDGDVILKANGEAVRSVAQVREAVAQANESGSRAVELDILREKRPRRLTLRW